MMERGQIFRLAAFLYGDDNDYLSKDKIHKRIIETVIYENGNKKISVHLIIDLIDEMYSFNFSEDEIINIIQDNDNFVIDSVDTEKMIYLSDSAITRIQSIERTMNLNAIIQNFSKYKGIDESIALEVIYKYLYNLFQNNIYQYLKLSELSCSVDISSDKHVEMNDDDIEIINNFLNWDNNEKNKAIFNIVNYSIEYCIISNRDKDSEMYFEALKNKVFYLDTNIIFRAIGIHGPNYLKRIKTFLTKCLETNQKLHISKNTEDEFFRTIDSQIDNIKKFHKRKINPNLFQLISDNDDMYVLYYEWKKNKPSSKIYLFRAFVYAKYEEFIKEYEIEIDDVNVINAESEEDQQKLDLYTKDISLFKNHLFEENEIDPTAKHDAINILICEKRRSNANTRLSETKYFITSTDKTLRSWDSQRNDLIPVVLHPSEWLGLILRFISRSNDEFKSFVSFLNLNKHNLTDNVQYDTILVGISEITESYEQQEQIIKSLIEIKFKDIFSNKNPRKIKEKVKNYAEKYLEKEIKIIREQNENFVSNIDEINRQLSKKDNETKDLKLKIEKLLTTAGKPQNDGNKLHDRLRILEEKNAKYKSILKENYKRLQIKKWKLKAKLCIPIIIIIGVFYLFQNICVNSDLNIASKFISWILGLDEVRRGFWTNINWLVLIGLEGYLITFIYCRLLNNSKFNSFVNEIKFPEDIA